MTRLTDAEALELYRGVAVHELGRMALERLLELHPEPYRTYVIDRNINYANLCTARCIFCNFYRRPGDAEAYVLTHEQIARKIEELIAIGGPQVLMQGGLVPDENHPSRQGLPFDWYLELLRFIKREYPSIHIHAFSPPEIWAFHRNFGCPCATCCYGSRKPDWIRSRRRRRNPGRPRAAEDRARQSHDRRMAGRHARSPSPGHEDKLHHDVRPY
jgi:cyclic dehypoxanthinyl futalosine synthase